jgi:hypothetical protein
LIETADRGFRDSTIRIIDECETAWAAGLPINGKNYLAGFTDARQMLT